MKTSAELNNFILDEEFCPKKRDTPKASLKQAISRIEAVAYTRGVIAALERVERLAAMVPGKMPAREVIYIIGMERDSIVADWNKNIASF